MSLMAAAASAAVAPPQQRRRPPTAVRWSLLAAAGVLLLLVAIRGHQGRPFMGRPRASLPRGLAAATSATAAPSADYPASAEQAAAAASQAPAWDFTFPARAAQAGASGVVTPHSSPPSSYPSSSAAAGWEEEAPPSADQQQALPADSAPADSAPQEPPAPVAGTPLPPGCQLLQRVCADQQSLVLMEPAFGPEAMEQLPLPKHDPAMHYNMPFGRGEGNPDCWNEAPLVLPPLLIRAAGAREPAPDLQHPLFDSHSLPLVLTPEWQENFGHTLGNSATWLHAHLTASNASWAGRVSLVVRTPLGMGLPRHWQPLVGPLVPAHPIQTFADFSNRLTPEQAASCSNTTSSSESSSGSSGGGSDSSGSSYGGAGGCSRSRCFEEMLVCAGLPELEAANISQAAQHLVRLNSPLPPTPDLNYSGCTRSSSSASASTLGRRGSSSGDSDQPVCLRVLFLIRSPKPAIRQVLNMEELLEECSRWQHFNATSGARFAASCATYQPGAELAANMAAVRTADVVIGTHGASMANAFFMSPGGAMVEVFTAGWTWHVHRIWLEQEALPQLQWWALTIEDQSAFSPGELESSLLPHPHLYKGWQGEDKRRRDQNLQVPWAGLARVLQEHAEVQAAGGMPAYLQRREAKRPSVHILAQAGGKLDQGGTSDMLGGGP